MNLTTRQRRFLTLSSAPDGQCPWNMPKGGPYLQSHELKPLTDSNLVSFSDEFDVWVTTPKGKLALGAER